MTEGPYVLAALVTPALMWSGLAATAAPILIHLLARRRFRRVRWAATDFLLQAHRENRRRLRIEQLILLALRCLAIAVIGAVVSRPFLAPGSWAAGVGGDTQTERVFILDDTYSMAATRDSGYAFDAARSALIDMIEQVSLDSPYDTVTVLLSSKPDAPLAVRAIPDAARSSELRQRLARLSPTHGADVHQAIRQLSKTHEDAIETGNLALCIVSDFQRKDWVPLDGDGPAASPFGPLLDWSAEQRDRLSITLLPIGDSSGLNVAVTGLSSGRSRLVAGLVEIVDARITNDSDQEVRGLEVKAYLDDSALPDVPPVRIAPRQTVSVPIATTTADIGSHRLSVEIGPDALDLDNTRRMGLNFSDALHVLVVNGEPAPESIRDEAALLATALKPSGPVPSGNDVRVVDTIEFSEVSLEETDVVVLANVYRLDPDSISRLEGFCSAGGGVVFFLGDQVDADVYNTLFHRDGGGLLRVRLEDQVRVPHDRPGVPLEVVDQNHALTRVFVGGAIPLGQQVHVRTYVRTTEPATPIEQDVETQEDGADSAADQLPARVLLRYGGDSSDAALIAGTFSEGRVLLCTTSCDQEWNDWASNPSFVITALEMIRYAAKPDGRQNQTQVGAPVRVTTDPAQYVTTATISMPVEDRTETVTVQAQAGPNEDGLEFTWDRTERAGFYTLTRTDRGGLEEELHVGVNPDAAEGDLSACGLSELIRLCQSVTEHYAVAEAYKTDRGSLGRRELWPALCIVLVGLLMSEQALAWWFGNRS